VRAAGAAIAGAAGFASQDGEQQQNSQAQPEPFSEDSVRTNISTALAIPRTRTSLPGKYPGVVAEVHHARTTEGFALNHADVVGAGMMLAEGMKALTGATDPRDAWAQFVTPGERIGIKINPVGGKLLSNTHELLQAIISGLESAAVPRSDIVIWDRFDDRLAENGYSAENYPGVGLTGLLHTEVVEGRVVMLGDDRLDKSIWYEFDYETEYDEFWAPRQINVGKFSYFTSILTQKLDKVINVPVLKNMGPMVTLCLKNMAFAVTSNCRRGHDIMNRFLAEVCAFPPVRDKVVLNIIDGLRGCFEGGPAAVAKYIWEPNRIWVASDPVAADKIGWDFIFSKRVEQGMAAEGDLEGDRKIYDFLARAENLGLGVYTGAPIDHRRIEF
jgi:hypothetical protein